jgi:hypothetical protein
MRFLVYLFLLSGCGYRWHPDFPTVSKPTITIPYVAGDGDGTLTSEIIRAVTSSGMAEVRHGQGDYRMQIAIVDSQSQTVGYRRDRQKVTGEIKKNIVSSEGRNTLTIEAALYEGSSDRIAYGPYRITAEADYDYIDGDSLQDLTFVTASGVPTTVLAFSLGQLESVEAAREAANHPLNEKLSQKIVDVIFSEW